MSISVSLDTLMRFATPDDQIIQVRVVGMELEFQDDAIISLQMSTKFSYADYQKIEADQLFNLELDEVERNARDDFDSALEVDIEIKIDPDLLLLISTYANTEEDSITYFVEQNHENVYNPLYSTSNWFALHVTQEQELPDDLEGTLKVGYQTKWTEEF